MKYNELIVLVPCHSLEDFPTELAEGPASSLLNAFSILWHPALLASTGAFPKWERGDEATDASPDRLIIVPTATEEMVPGSWIERARREGANVITGETERQPMLKAALQPLDSYPEVDPETVADFLALGTAYLQSELLTRHMRNFSHLDEVHMQREAVAAAQAALSHDKEATSKHLGHCFEMLYECRERYYPVDCYMIDLCLVNPDLANDQFRNLLKSPTPLNLLAQGQDWQRIVDADAECHSLIREAVESGRVEIVGGDDADLPTTLMSIDSTLFQMKQGRERIQKLFGKSPITWARKRFGIGTHLPQILVRMGYEGALHFAMDDGVYPDEEQTQLRWEGSDGTAIDAFSRIPLAADSASSFIRFAQRMSESMDYDHTAAIVFARWPKMRTPWMDDLRRAARFSPCLGKFVTLSEFFEMTDAPGRMSEFKAGEYFSPSLLHAVARQEASPISRHLQYWTLHNTFNATDWCRATNQLLTDKLVTESEIEPLAQSAHPEAETETSHHVAEEVHQHLQNDGQKLADMVSAKGIEGEGLVVINPLSFARKCIVTFPEGYGPGQDPSILHKQVDSQGAIAIVNVPACGFVWLTMEPNPQSTNAGKTPLAEEFTLRNDFFEVNLSNVTGGIASVQTFRRSPNRISQQLAYRFGQEKIKAVETEHGRETSRTFYSEMHCTSAKVLSSGPAMGAIETCGDLIDPSNGKALIKYKQVTKVYREKPVVHVQLELDPVSTPSGDPWTNYVGLRFAWKHASAALTASMQQGAHGIKMQRIESPQFIEIADESYRTTILTPGLPFHRRTDTRMLDTLLLVEGEERTTFEFAVAVDSQFPMQSHLDAYSHPICIRTKKAPQQPGSQGWFYFVGAANVQLTRILPGSTDSSFRVRLMETEGRSKVFSLRTLLKPKTARQVDYQGKTISNMNVEGDTIRVEISPYEVCDVEIEID